MISSFNQFQNFTQNLGVTATMPVLFMGHGSPMNGIELNEFSTKWMEVAAKIPVPSAVLVISAHWFTRGTRITAMDFPQTIHDFGGFVRHSLIYSIPRLETLNLRARQQNW